jgi:hypothetical protein
MIEIPYVPASQRRKAAVVEDTLIVVGNSARCGK